MSDTIPTTATPPPTLFGRALPRLLQVPYDSAPLSSRSFWAIVGLIMVGALVLRLAWLIHFGWDTPEMNWNGTPILTSVDGYYFGVGAQSLLDGTDFGRLRVPGAENYAIVFFGWFLTALLPVTLDQVMVYLPPVLGSLVAIPTAILARDLLGARPALVATALAMAGPGFVLRTSAGFFDTDAFAIALPIIALIFILRLFDRRDPRQALFAAVTLAVHTFFYDQGDPVGAVMATVAIAYAWVFHRKDAAIGPAIGTITAVLGLAVIELPWFIRAPIVVVAWFALTRGLKRGPILRWGGLALGVGGLFMSLAWRSIAYKWFFYTGAAADGPLLGVGASEGLSFGDTTQYVSEIRRATVDVFAQRLTGSIVTTTLGGLGVLLLALNRRSLILAAPIVAVGAFSLLGGSRFAMYLGIPFAIGLGGVAAYAARLVPGRSAVLKAGALFAVAAALLAPAAVLAWRTAPRVAITSDEVALLTQLRTVVQPGDAVVAWWDYGYPISYYTRARTIVDGARRGNEAGIVAEVLMNPSQRASANLARTIAESSHRLAGTDWSVADEVFRYARYELGLTPRDYIKDVARPEHVPIPATRRAYLYLPFRMVAALPAIQALRPTTDGPHEAAFASTYLNTRTEGTRLILGPSTTVDGESVEITDGGVTRRLRGIVAVHEGAGNGRVERRMRYPHAPTTGIFLNTQGAFIECNGPALNGLWSQVFALRATETDSFRELFRNNTGVIVEILR